MKLNPTKLYLGDNGRSFCGTLRCAGHTAFSTGRDLSGQRVMAVKPADAITHGITCEGCGMGPESNGAVATAEGATKS